eukprot:SAG31_NODE_2231_length_6144_cov_3.142763_3_plen_122_part_00
MSSQGGANAYRAPARREGATASIRDGDRFGRPGGDLATVRITNLSEEATEDDVKRLCQAFGTTQRIYLAKDKYTQASKGFAFVNFHRRGTIWILANLATFQHTAAAPSRAPAMRFDEQPPE